MFSRSLSVTCRSFSLVKLEAALRGVSGDETGCASVLDDGFGRSWVGVTGAEMLGPGVKVWDSGVGGKPGSFFISSSYSNIKK